jgi:hypothetical protein
MTASPPLVDDASEGTEKLGDAMNFVQDDQAILVLPEEEGWLCKPVAVLPSL